MSKFLKKVIALIIVVVSIISFTGCGMQTATVPEDNKTKISKFKSSDGIEGICKALLKKEYIPDDCVKTKAELIGAKEGYRIDNVSVNGSKFSMEIYQYDDINSETAKGVVDSVKDNGSFDLFGRTVSYCYMSKNDKYLLIYPDEKSTTGKADDEDNAKRKDEVLKIVNSAK